MDRSQVIGQPPQTGHQQRDVRVLFAFAAIYLLWGGTFLAIRIAVLQLPPFFTAGQIGRAHV
jgi:hypothetical protein